MTKIVIGPRSGMNWIQLSTGEIACPFARSTMDVVKTWAQGHLTVTHPEPGRDGPVCPSVGPSFRSDLMWVGRISGTLPRPSFVRSVLLEAMELLPTLPPTEGPAAVLRTLLIVLPDVRDYALIDDLHDELRSAFVERGTMLGQFYPGCDQPGLWNGNRPLDAPIPIFVVRSMVATDFPFLLERPEWMAAYVNKFAPALPAYVRETVVSRLTASSSTDVLTCQFEAAPAAGSDGSTTVVDRPATDRTVTSSGASDSRTNGRANGKSVSTGPSPAS
ncbi:DUF6875 domain-containing protein [Nocardia sp. CWNU-33]|uniref:DUF6875 domain-containing protein n=1 Tax=Nocardia sp. CWNU-33 TaxID=3392117 RepID=UPI00398F1E75